jgi:hypothetical protein
MNMISFLPPTYRKLSAGVVVALCTAESARKTNQSFPGISLNPKIGLSLQEMVRKGEQSQQLGAKQVHDS